MKNTAEGGSILQSKEISNLHSFVKQLRARYSFHLGTLLSVELRLAGTAS